MKYDSYEILREDGNKYFVLNPFGMSFSVNKLHYKNGEFSDPFYPSVRGVGYFGVGKYKCSTGGKKTKEYTLWKTMLTRCYDLKSLMRMPSYLNCSVCEEWHNFQNFAAWCIDQKGFNNSGWCLDKDLLSTKDKVYSPNTCVFIPNKLNTLFTKIVCKFFLYKGKYNVQYREEGIKKLKSFKEEGKALDFYKEIKDKEVDMLLNLYKDGLDQRVVEFLVSRGYWKQLNGTAQFKAISNKYLEKKG